MAGGCALRSLVERSGGAAQATTGRRGRASRCCMQPRNQKLPARAPPPAGLVTPGSPRLVSPAAAAAARRCGSLPKASKLPSAAPSSPHSSRSSRAALAPSPPPLRLSPSPPPPRVLRCPPATMADNHDALIRDFCDVTGADPQTVCPPPRPIPAHLHLLHNAPALETCSPCCLQARHLLEASSWNPEVRYSWTPLSAPLQALAGAALRKLTLEIDCSRPVF